MDAGNKNELRFFSEKPHFESAANISTFAVDGKPSFEYSLNDIQDFRNAMESFESSQYKLAQMLFERSQFPPSFVMMGILYSKDGRIGPKDLQMSSSWFEKAREQSNFFHNLDLNSDDLVLFVTGLYFFHVENNYELSLKFFRYAADKGLSCALCRVGYCYQAGEGVKKDMTEAAKYFKLAADQGNSRAQVYLGTCFQHGDGVDKEEFKAFHYFKLAAAQGNALAQCSLGYCYENGVGIEKDLKKAIHYYQLSADQGDSVAKSSLGLCLKGQ
jgi:TPR repeat protein